MTSNQDHETIKQWLTEAMSEWCEKAGILAFGPTFCRGEKAGGLPGGNYWLVIVSDKVNQSGKRIEVKCYEDGLIILSMEYANRAKRIEEHGESRTSITHLASEICDFHDPDCDTKVMEIVKTWVNTRIVIE